MTTDSKLDPVLVYIATATKEELILLNSRINNELTLRRKQKVLTNKRKVQPGETYRVTGITGPHNNCLFTVSKIHRSRVSGSFEGETTVYMVPFSCLDIEE